MIFSLVKGIGSYLATIAWKLPEPWKRLEPVVMGTWKMVSHFISWWFSGSSRWFSEVYHFLSSLGWCVSSKASKLHLFGFYLVAIFDLRYPTWHTKVNYLELSWPIHITWIENDPNDWCKKNLSQLAFSEKHYQPSFGWDPFSAIIHWTMITWGHRSDLQSLQMCWIEGSYFRIFEVDIDMWPFEIHGSALFNKSRYNSTPYHG